MQLRHLAVVMPAYNEAEGLPGFLAEIAEHVEPHVGTLSLVVVDDRSTDETARVLAALEDPRLTVVTAPRNRGHGPTALEAYRAGLALAPDALVHVDGDGQFQGSDFPAVLEAIARDGVDVVHGVRTGREEPWYRRTLTRLVGVGVAAVARHRVSDVNTPLRAYRPEALRTLLALCPDEALVPHVHFSLNERRSGLTVVEVAVRSLPRRGAETVGTMWGAARTAPGLPPKKLLRFSARAAAEVWRYSLSPRRARRRVRAGETVGGAA